MSASHAAPKENDAECSDCPPMSTVPAGAYQMGKTVNRGYGEIDGPTHTVTIEQPFKVAKHEVTLGEFRTFTKATGYVSAGKCNVYKKDTNWFIDPARNWADPGFPQQETHPVVCVSWRDAQAYIDWLNGKTGRRYRLPSEAEWEYIATTANLGNGKITHDVANIGKVECCGGKTEGKDVWIYTAPIGSLAADKYGLHDIRGNVWEWQRDCYHADYNGAPVNGDARESCPEPGYYVVRGGSYGDAGEFLEERFRLRGPEDQGYFTVGFRLAESASAAQPNAAAQPVSAMLKATRARNLSALGGFLSSTVEPEIVYYWGETVRGRDAIVEWHREWFAEPGWTLAQEKLERDFIDQKLAALSYSVEYIKSAERKFRILIDCTLIKEGSDWKIARMQQTLLEGPQ
jgi:formylglycine-generating enzyme required for sulfatase activity